MGGVSDVIFGKEEPARQTGTAPTLTGGQQDVLKLLTSLLKGQIGKGVEAYPGQMVPGASPLQAGSFGMLEEILKGAGAGEGPLGELLKFEPEKTKEYWETSVKAPAMQMFEEDVLPKVLEPFIASGIMDSSAAQRAMAKSGERLTTDLGGILGQLLFQSEQAYKGQLPQAMGLIESLGLGAGGAQRGIEQERLGEPYQKWATSQPYANPYLNLLQTVLGSRAFEPIVQGPTQTQGLLSQMLPAAGMAAGGYLGNPNLLKGASLTPSYFGLAM